MSKTKFEVLHDKPEPLTHKIQLASRPNFKALNSPPRMALTKEPSPIVPSPSKSDLILKEPIKVEDDEHEDNDDSLSLSSLDMQNLNII